MRNSKTKPTRRDFLRLTGQAVAAGVLGTSLLGAGDAHAENKPLRTDIEVKTRILSKPKPEFFDASFVPTDQAEPGCTLRAGDPKMIYVHRWNEIPESIKGVDEFTKDFDKAIYLATPGSTIVVWEGTYSCGLGPSYGGIYVPEGKSGLTIWASDDAVIRFAGPIRTRSPVTFRNLTIEVTPGSLVDGCEAGVIDSRHNHHGTRFVGLTIR